MKIAPKTAGDFADYEQWHYQPPYDFYDSDQEPVLNPERYFAVHDDDEGALIGFLYFEPKDDVLEYGLGLRPDLTGKGLGLDVFHAGLEFGRERYGPSLIRLSSTRPTNARSGSTSAPAFARPDGTSAPSPAGVTSSS